MRELKFRAWDLDKNKYHYDICIKPNGKIIALEIYDGEMSPIRTRCIAEQYTGLKDKNDKEIYEGDIVRIYNMDNRGKIEGAYIPLFDEMNGEYVWCKNEDIDSAEYGGFPIWAKYRVIGNIHENKELFEMKKEEE